MKKCEARHVCFADLKNYRTKNDLFENLSEDDKRELRKNIGAASQEEFQNLLDKKLIVPINYDELQHLMTQDPLGLDIGVRYLLSDFQTIYTSNTLNRDVWGRNGDHPSPYYSILLTPISSKELDTSAIVFYPLGEDKYELLKASYDISPVGLSDGSFNKGTITYLEDKHNNTAYYDFKAMQFRRFDLEFSGSIHDLFTFNKDLVNGTESSKFYKNVHLNSNTKNIVFCGGGININITDSFNNTFMHILKDVSIINTKEVLIKNSIINAEFNIQKCIIDNSNMETFFKNSSIKKHFNTSKNLTDENFSTYMSYMDYAMFSPQIIKL